MIRRDPTRLPLPNANSELWRLMRSTKHRKEPKDDGSRKGPQMTAEEQTYRGPPGPFSKTRGRVNQHTATNAGSESVNPAPLAGTSVNPGPQQQEVLDAVKKADQPGSDQTMRISKKVNNFFVVGKPFTTPPFKSTVGQTRVPIEGAKSQRQSRKMKLAKPKGLTVTTRQANNASKKRAKKPRSVILQTARAPVQEN